MAESNTRGDVEDVLFDALEELFPPEAGAELQGQHAPLFDAPPEAEELEPEPVAFVAASSRSMGKLAVD